MEISESIHQTVTREMQEEIGLQVEPIRIVGSYTDPKRVVEFADGAVRQEFSICFVCRILGGRLHTSAESVALTFFAPQDIEQLSMDESNRLRIKHYLEHRDSPFIG